MIVLFRFVFILIVTFFLFNTCRCQQNTVDSILTALNKYHKAESQLLLAYAYQFRDFKKAEETFKILIDQATAKKDTLLLIRSYYYFAKYFSVQDNRVLASDYAQRALLLTNKFSGNQQMLWKSLLEIFLVNNKLTTATRMSHGTDIFDSTVVKKWRAFAETNEREGNWFDAAEIYLDLVHYRTWYWVRKYPLKSIPHENIFTYIKQARQCYAKANFAEGIGRMRMELGANYFYYCFYQDAASPVCGKEIAEFKKAYPYIKNLGNKHLEARILNFFAYMQLRKKHFDSTRYFVNKAEKIALEMGDAIQLIRFKWTYRDMYDSMKDFKKSTDQMWAIMSLKDSLFFANSAQQMADIRNIYDNQLREEKLKELDQQNQLKEGELVKSKLLFWSLVILSSIIVIGLSLYVIQRREIENSYKKNAELNAVVKRNLENQLNEAQLTAARAQMNPHFVFNAISSIQNLILKENKTDAIDYLNDFSRLTRQTLDNATKQTVLLKDEISFLENYLHLEKLRNGDLFDYEIRTERVDLDYDRIPTMLVQPIVENAIKHGLKPKRNKGFVSITFMKQDDDVLVVVVDDNGVGRKVSIQVKEASQHSSKALQLTELRIQLLNSKEDLSTDYPLQFEDKVDENGSPVGTKVTLTIPLAKLV